uniref:Uncharacterized protein n=1 Tax=Oryza brachyantha TaxID=4533 RepID=J3LNJ3_ORYBR
MASSASPSSPPPPSSVVLGLIPLLLLLLLRQGRQDHRLLLRKNDLPDRLLRDAERRGELGAEQGVEHGGVADQELRVVPPRGRREAEEHERPAARRHLAEREEARDVEHVAGAHRGAHRQRPVREDDLDAACAAEHHAVLRRPRVHVR